VKQTKQYYCKELLGNGMKYHKNRTKSKDIINC